jgi:hypothetical protein
MHVHIRETRRQKITPAVNLQCIGRRPHGCGRSNLRYALPHHQYGLPWQDGVLVHGNDRHVDERDRLFPSFDAGRSPESNDR